MIYIFNKCLLQNLLWENCSVTVLLTQVWSKVVYFLHISFSYCFFIIEFWREWKKTKNLNVINHSCTEESESHYVKKGCVAIVLHFIIIFHYVLEKGAHSEYFIHFRSVTKDPPQTWGRGRGPYLPPLPQPIRMWWYNLDFGFIWLQLIY